MQVAVYLQPEASEQLNLALGTGQAASIILQTARDLGVEVRQLTDPSTAQNVPESLRRQLLVTVPDRVIAARVIARFEALPITDSVYLKPDAVPALPDRGRKVRQ